MKNRINLAVLISGRGSNLKSIIESIRSRYLDNVALKVVVANKEAPGLKFAQDFGVNTFVVPRIIYGKKITLKEHDSQVMEILEKYNIDLVCLAGYLQVLQSKLISRYRNRVMNIHPALLPAFGGTIHAQRDALEYGAKISGCTVHFADTGIDTGPIIIQAAVPVKEDDTEESLSKRILKFEHKIYPKAIKMFAEGRLKVDGRKVIIKRN
jgi:phosphoribosylglycinamide formyltransferase-1